MALMSIHLLESLASDFRLQLIELLHAIRTGHPGGSLSATEILTVLYYVIMNIDPKNPNMEGRDRFVLSKGHAAPMLYIILANKGFFPKDDLWTTRQINSYLQGHPCAHKTPGVEISTGPVGIGFSAALGLALGAKLNNSKEYIYALLGDGELQEGVIWETAMSAAKFHADNLIAVVDNNGVQLDGTVDEIMPLGSIKDKFLAFGWNVLQCDGHNIDHLIKVFKEAKKKNSKPTVIVAHTIKGKGVSFMEGKYTWHGRILGEDEYLSAISEVKERSNHESN